jgi:hypothetical protein
MRKDLTDKVFGRLTVLGYSKTIGKRAYWNCLCSCGNTTEVQSQQLTCDKTKSCGCLNIEKIIARSTKHSQSIRGSISPEYKSYFAMKNRCYNQNATQYKNWGGRGIKVCDRWLSSFENFLEDMGKKPSAKHSLDRINNNGNYEPNNCRWATNLEQNENKRNNKLILNLETGVFYKTSCEAAKAHNIKRQTLQKRIIQNKSKNLIYV